MGPSLYIRIRVNSIQYSQLEQTCCLILRSLLWTRVWWVLNMENIWQWAMNSFWGVGSCDTDASFPVHYYTSHLETLIMFQGASTIIFLSPPWPRVWTLHELGKYEFLFDVYLTTWGCWKIVWCIVGVSFKTVAFCEKMCVLKLSFEFIRAHLQQYFLFFLQILIK